MICSRCRLPCEGEVITTDGPSRCVRCAPQEASVLDFLWQFPTSTKSCEVLRFGDWFFMVHETSIVAVHDEAWPTLYEGDRYVRISPKKNPATAAFMTRILDSDPVYTSKLMWSKLKKGFASDGLVRFFGVGIEVQAELMRRIIPLAFAETNPRKSITVDFVDVGLRFECDGRIVVLPLANETVDPVAEFFPDVHTSELAETAEILEQLDALLS